MPDLAAETHAGSGKPADRSTGLSLPRQRRHEPMTRPIVIQPGALLALLLGWLALLAGAFALGLRLA